jgi:hypothetical protein
MDKKPKMASIGEVEKSFRMKINEKQENLLNLLKKEIKNPAKIERIWKKLDEILDNGLGSFPQKQEESFVFFFIFFLFFQS